MSAVLSNPQFARRVSFNNLSPDYIGLDTPAVGASKPKVDYEDFGYGGKSVFGDIDNLFKVNPISTTRRKSKSQASGERPKSILKNKDVNPRVMDTTINYHENGEVVESDSDSEEASPSTKPSQENGKRMYTHMTDEQLMELDPQFRLTKSKTNNMDQFKFDSQKTYYLPSSRRSSVVTNSNMKSVYPSSNENNYKSMSLTVRHVEYDRISLHRTILTVISGRKHTWNSTDWFLMTNQGSDTNRLLVDGDHLIVGCLIPLKFFKQCEQKKKNGEEVAYKKCESLLEYLYSSLPADLKIKITVELITDNDFENDNSKKPLTGSKYMLSHLTKQYQPTLIVIGNKSTNLNFKYPIKIKNSQNQKDEYLIKLSSYIVKYSTVPVIIVGNSTMYHFDESTRKQNSNITFTFTPSSEHKGSSSSIESCDSFNGECESISTKLEGLWNSDSHDKFKDMITAVSDNSFNDSMNYIRAIGSKGENVRIDNKIHSMYRSQTQNSTNTRSVNSNDRMYKVRSMISYNEDDEIKNDQIRKEKKKSNLKQSKSDSQITQSLPKKTKKSIWKRLNVFKSRN